MLLFNNLFDNIYIYIYISLLVLLISEIENYFWTKEMSSCLNVHIEEDSKYPDWEPLKHRSLCNRKDDDKDLFEINNDQFNSG